MTTAIEPRRKVFAPHLPGNPNPDQLLDLTEKQAHLIFYTEGVTLFEGRKRSGKTTAAVALAKRLSEEFGFPVCSSMPLLPAFGPYKFFDMKIFVENLKALSEATKGEKQSVADRAMDELFEAGRIPAFIDSVVFIDEMYQYCDSSNRDRVSRLLGYWVSQIGHFRSPLIATSPALHMLDRRVRNQIDRQMRCFTDIYEDGTRITTAVGTDISLDEPLELVVNANKYQKFFNSWVLTPIRSNAYQMISEPEPKALPESKE